MAVSYTHLDVYKRQPLQVGGNYVNNASLTYNGTEWTPTRPIYWNDGSYDVYAYYPLSLIHILCTGNYQAAHSDRISICIADSGILLPVSGSDSAYLYGYAGFKGCIRIFTMGIVFRLPGVGACQCVFLSLIHI